MVAGGVATLGPSSVYWSRHAGQKRHLDGLAKNVRGWAQVVGQVQSVVREMVEASELGVETLTRMYGFWQDANRIEREGGNMVEVGRMVDEVEAQLNRWAAALAVVTTKPSVFHVCEEEEELDSSIDSRMEAVAGSSLSLS